MLDTDLDNIYKSALNLSHYDGLRAVYDAGYQQGIGVTPTAVTPDQSLTQAAPSAYVTITQDSATPGI